MNGRGTMQVPHDGIQYNQNGYRNAQFSTFGITPNLPEHVDLLADF